MKRPVHDLRPTLPSFLKTIFCALYIFIAGFSVAFAGVNPATVRSKMQQLSKEKQLPYLRNICDDAIGKDDKKQYELLRIYIAEAKSILQYPMSCMA